MEIEYSIYIKVNRVFCDVFMREDILLTPALTAHDLPGWDSFKQIEIIMATEEMFGIRFSTRDLDSLRSVGDLVKAIQARIVK